MTPRRRKLLLGLAASLAAPGLLFGQAAKPFPRVAFLFNGTVAGEKVYVNAFVRGMHEQGYVDGRNVVLDIRYGNLQFERFPEIIGEMLASKPDVLVVAGSQASWAAKRATSTVPVIMSTVGNPDGQGLVASLARPGGNLTGQAILTEQLGTKRQQLLRDTFPKASRVASLYSSSNPFVTQAGLDRGVAIAAQLGFELTFFDVKKADELDAALAAIVKLQPHAVMVGEEAMFFSDRRKIVEFLLQHRIPSMHGSREAVIDGGLMSYTTNIAEHHRRSATYVHKILKGAKPAELPIEQSTHIELLLNLKTAKTLGITIPQSVLLRADRVIE